MTFSFFKWFVFFCLSFVMCSGCGVVSDQLTETEKWENGDVYYYFDESLDMKDKEIVENIFNTIENNTKCVFFIEDEENPKAVHIKYSETDYLHASIGSNNAYNSLSILKNDKCRPKDIYHEIFHVLGLKHEHQRPDRDSYINIVRENIQHDCLIWFEVINEHLYDINEYAYDINSIMHYHAFAFSKNDEATIEFNAKTSKLTDPTPLDYEKLISVYRY